MRCCLVHHQDAEGRACRRGSGCWCVSGCGLDLCCAFVACFVRRRAGSCTFALIVLSLSLPVAYLPNLSRRFVRVSSHARFPFGCHCRPLVLVLLPSSRLGRPVGFLVDRQCCRCFLCSLLLVIFDRVTVFDCSACFLVLWLAGGWCFFWTEDCRVVAVLPSIGAFG